MQSGPPLALWCRVSRIDESTNVRLTEAAPDGLALATIPQLLDQRHLDALVDFRKGEEAVRIGVPARVERLALLLATIIGFRAEGLKDLLKRVKFWRGGTADGEHAHGEVLH